MREYLKEVVDVPGMQPLCDSNIHFGRDEIKEKIKIQQIGKEIFNKMISGEHKETAANHMEGNNYVLGDEDLPF
jgi:hypothetical protein